VVSLAILGAVVYLLGAAAGRLIVPVFGHAYADSVGIFRILLAVQAARLALVPLGLLFFAMDRTRAGAAFNAVELGVLAGSGFLLIPRYGASGAAWSQVFVLVAAALYRVVYMSRLRGQTVSAEGRLADRGGS
jgi:O-antigen/teichoic acid export membrane protein